LAVVAREMALVSTPPTAPKPIAFGASYTMTVGSLHSLDHTWLSWISNSVDNRRRHRGKLGNQDAKTNDNGDGGRTKGSPARRDRCARSRTLDMTFRQRSGGDGQTIFLSGAPYVIIGIIAPTFNVGEFGPAPEVQVPFHLDLNSTDRGGIGRLGLRC
jgi:hypothetical protein